MSKERERERLSSRLGFILLSAGCAIGLGNVWRFPYITGRYGGAAFVLIYLLFLALIGIPVMSMEFAIGRAGRKNIAGALRTLEPEGTKWHMIGPVAIAGNYILLMFYSVITGWLIYYLISFATGGINSSFTPEMVGAFFGDLTANPGLQIAFLAIALLLTALIVAGGVRNGVEKITKVMMVILFLLMITLAARSCLLDGAIDGILFFVKPDFNNLFVQYGFAEPVFAAMGQAFFTLSLGIGAMAIFGSYLGNERSLPGESLRILVLDTSIALLSGFIIFPICAAFSVEAGAGPSLLFISLPNVFTKMAGGNFWGAVFFLAMVFAALSTLIAVFENIVAYWIDSRGWTRKKAVFFNLALLFILSIPCALGFNILSSFQPFGPGTGVLDFEDFLVSNLILPLGSLSFVLFCTRKNGWGWDAYRKEANQGEGLRISDKLRFYCFYILPVIILLVTVYGIWGVLS